MLRGAKTMTGMKDFNPIQNRVPALQYLDSVEAGSVADRAGLQPGDFILAVSFFDFLHRVRIYFFPFFTSDQWRRSGQGFARDCG